MKIRSFDSFNEKLIHLAKVQKAMGHPARLAIMSSLKKNPGQSVKQIVDQLPFSQSTVSQHLYRLRSVSLVDAVPFKTSTIYSLNENKIESFKTAFEATFKQNKNKKQLSLFD
jgi:ArsR family transcriptional regulator, arsenate/arsenite/antimonite-responsive transcriptional repressor